MLNFDSMVASFKITSAQSKVLSNICSNLVVVWLIAIFATNDTILLVRNIIIVATFWFIAIKAEEESLKHD